MDLPSESDARSDGLPSDRDAIRSRREFLKKTYRSADALLHVIEAFLERERDGATENGPVPSRPSA